MKNCYEEIFEYVNSLQIIDSHEHLPFYEKWRETKTDILKEYLFHYFRCDLISAGLKPSELKIVLDHNRPLTERWKLVEPYWNLARNTGYCRSLDLSVKAIYGADRIDGNSIEWLNEEFQKSLQPGHYRKVLKNLSNIKYSVLNLEASNMDCDREYFRATFLVTNLIRLPSWNYIEKMENANGIPVACLDDWLTICDMEIDKALKNGAVGLKCILAYVRSLHFENVSKHDAEEFFNRILLKKGRPYWVDGAIEDSKAFQDYMMHYILRIANRKGLVFQFHTGLQEGNQNYIYNSEPSLLSNLFVQYPNVKFVLFHIGYPYQHTLSILGKMFPNVHVDMCIAHMVSPAASIQILDDWLDSMPVNKITAFGGDYSLVDGVYGHQLLARMNVSTALAKKVEAGIFGMDDVKWMANRLFYENPKMLYGE